MCIRDRLLPLLCVSLRSVWPPQLLGPRCFFSSKYRILEDWHGEKFAQIANFFGIRESFCGDWIGQRFQVFTERYEARPIWGVFSITKSALWPLWGYLPEYNSVRPHDGMFCFDFWIVHHYPREAIGQNIKDVGSTRSVFFCVALFIIDPRNTGGLMKNRRFEKHERS